MVHGNISIWGPQAERWLSETMADVVLFAEHRMHGDDYAKMIRIVGRLAWCAVGGELARKGDVLPSL